MSCFGRVVNLHALVEQRTVQTRMALVGCNESNRAVTMLVVVPLNEGADPLPGGQQTFKGTTRIGRAVFHRSKQRFREWIVVAHRRAAKRGHHAQRLQGGQCCR